MTGTEILGTIALASSVIYTGMGLPMQIIKNYRTKSTKGLSLFFVIIMFASLVAWSLYGVAKDDFFIIIPNAMGAIIGLVLMAQFCIYRKSPSDSTKDGESKSA